MASTPQEQLARIDSSTRLKVTVLCIVCAVALFIEFLLSVTLPAKNGFDSFLYFVQSSITAVNPQFQLGLTVFVTILGIVVCLGGILGAMGHFERILLAFVPLQIVFALLNMICFVLWAMVTELWNWFASGLPFCIIAILAAFGSALAATQVLTLPVYVSKPSNAAVVRQTN